VAIRNGDRRLSGVILKSQSADGRTFVASAAHGFNGTIGGQCQATLSDGRTVLLTLRQHDPQADYALLELPPGEYRGAELADVAALKSGERALIVGYADGPMQYYDTSLVISSSGQLCAQQTTIKGFSGGGLWVRNRLAGVHTACYQQSYFCPIRIVHDGYHKLGHAIAVGVGWCPRCPRQDQAPSQPAPQPIPQPAPQVPSGAARHSWLLNVVDMEGTQISSTTFSTDDDFLEIKIPAQVKPKDYDKLIADLQAEIAKLKQQEYTAELYDKDRVLIKTVKFSRDKPLRLQNMGIDAGG
jgi:hypothetical protein